MAGAYHLGPLLGFDLETTGPDPLTALIVTASLVFQPGPSAEVTTCNWLVDPGVDIPAEAAAIHGVTTERAQVDGQPAATALPEIANAVAEAFAAGTPVVAFNAAYDFTVLTMELARHGLAPLAAVFPVIDPHVIDKQADKYRKGKKTLGATAAHYGVDLLDAHTAEADALAAVHIARALPEKYQPLQVEATKIHDWTIGWRAQQAAGLQEYFRRQNPDAVVNGQWPIQTVEGN